MASAIFNHSLSAAHQLLGSQVESTTNQTAATAETSSTSSSSTNSATISANDFLTLLVTEMQNQDPTANTDPNEYINQLVNVNSLEQLIDINQTLSSALKTSTTSTGGASSAPVTAASASSSAGSSLTSSTAGTGAGNQTSALNPFSSQPASVVPAAQSVLSGISSAAGNLALPNASAASRQVGHALDGHAKALSAAQFSINHP